MIRRIAALLLALLAAAAGGEALAHALDPGFLELQALDGEAWRVTWRKPALASGAPMPIEAILPETCAPRRPPGRHFDGRAFVAGWIAACPGGLAGGEIAIERLGATRTDVLVRYELVPGEAQAMRLTPDAPAFQVPAAPGMTAILTSYVGLGIEHILQG